MRWFQDVVDFLWHIPDFKEANLGMAKKKFILHPFISASI
jgi:hypothetical protein